MKQVNKPSIHLAFDANEANVRHRVGSNVYAFEIMKQFYKLVEKSPDLKVTILLATEPQLDFPGPHDRWTYQVLTPSPFWTQLALPWHLWLNQNTYDVFYTPGHYAPRWSRVPYISSVMDLAFLHFPYQFKKRDYLQLRDWTKYSVQNAQKVVTISAFSKKEIEEWYQKKAKDIIVAYPAAALSQEIPSPPARTKQLKALKIAHPYILHLGTIQPRKNISGLVEAFEQLKRAHSSQNLHSKTHAAADRRFLSLSGLQLVIAGKPGWLSDPIMERIAQSPFHKDIILTGFIDESTKLTLLKEAHALAMVGHFEGFGIPALESLLVETIPVVSEHSSLPEVVGKAGITVNPDQIESIATGLRTALSLSPKEKAVLRKEARDQVKRFSWQKSAELILETVLKVAHDRK